MDVARQLGVARRGIAVAWAQRAVGHVAVAWLSVSLATLPLQGATHRRPGGALVLGVAERWTLAILR